MSRFPEESQSIKSVVENILKDCSYSHSKTQQWCEEICEGIEKALHNLKDNGYKVVVNCLIMEKNEEVGFKTYSLCCFEEKKDEVLSTKFENGTIRAIVTVYVLSRA